MSLIIDSIGGNCPVQSEGTFDGIPYYFRARGERWTLLLGIEGETETREWSEHYGNGPFDAGWMSDREAEQFIRNCYDQYSNGAKSKTKEYFQYVMDMETNSLRTEKELSCLNKKYTKLLTDYIDLRCQLGLNPLPFNYTEL